MPETLLHVAGLILARGGSQGIPLKNITPLANHPLLVWSLGAMKAFGRFDSIWVSTDHPLIAQSASQMGASVFHRSSKFAKCGSPSVDAVQEFLSAHPEVDIVGLVQCTSPFLQPEFLHKAYELIIEQSYDSVFSVTRDKKLRWSEADFNDDDEEDNTNTNEDSDHEFIIQSLNPVNNKIDTNDRNNIIHNNGSMESSEIIDADSNCDKLSCCCFDDHSISSPVTISSLQSESKSNEVNTENDLQLETRDESYSQEAMIQIRADGNEDIVKSNKETKSDQDPISFQVIEVVNSSMIENNIEITHQDLNRSNDDGCYRNIIDANNVVKSSIKSDMKRENDIICKQDIKSNPVMKPTTMVTTTLTRKNVACCCSR